MAISQYRIGYLLQPKSIAVLNIHAIPKSWTDQHGVEFVKIDDTRPLDEQGPFDCIVHKISDYARGAADGNPLCCRVIAELESFCLRNPLVDIIDPISTVMLLADRSEMTDIIRACEFELNGRKVLVPNYVTLTQKEGSGEVLKNANVKFPILIKPQNAAEGIGCHDMMLIFHEGALDDLRVPCVAQQFINHDAILYKVFVVDGNFCVVSRPSVRNLVAGCTPTYFFDSHDVSKPLSVSYLNDYARNFVAKVSYMDDSLLDHSVVEEIIRRLNMIVPSSLLGVDVLVEKETGHYYVVDVNYFPGYCGMHMFQDEILRYFTRLSARKSSRMQNGVTSCNHSTV